VQPGRFPPFLWWLSRTTFAVLILMVVRINFSREALLQAFDPKRQDGIR
jgi:ABC-type dipeptide/oligopeptide/nickel transport system permease subunit